ncbi:MAG TPA: hypothetical protein VL523_02545 [Terriglobia bacterium]|nr:hypothetical protein [Terriglobia bacterium]
MKSELPKVVITGRDLTALDDSTEAGTQQLRFVLRLAAGVAGAGL